MIDVILGAMFVVIDSTVRFNTPPNSRSSTTAGRYYTFAIAYVAIMLGAYVVLARSPQLLALFTPSPSEVSPTTTVPEAHATNESDVVATVLGWDKSPRVAGLSSALLAALVLTVFLPKIVVLRSLDERLRKWLQGMARIPREARRLARALQRAPWHFPIDHGEELAELLERRGVRLQDAMAVAERPSDERLMPQYLWTKVTTLMAEIDGLGSEHRFAAFYEKFKEERQVIEGRFQRLRPRAERILACLGELPHQPDEPRLERAALELRETLRSACDDLLQGICAFLARASLCCARRARQRCECWRRLGFDPPEERQGIPSHLLAAVLLLVLLVMGAVFFGGGSTYTSLKETVIKVAQIAAIYTTSICCAVWVLNRWLPDRRPPEHFPPVGFYLLAGISAGLVAAVLTFMAAALIRGQSLATVWADFQEQSPWLLMAFAAGFGVSALADNVLPKLPRLSQRIWEGLALMVGLAVTCGFVALMLPEVTDNPPSPWLTVSTNGLIGFMLGVLVPTSYRDERANAAMDEDDASGAVVAAP